MEDIATVPEKMAWQFGYRIDWDAPVTGARDEVAALAQPPPATAGAPR